MNRKACIRQWGGSMGGSVYVCVLQIRCRAWTLSSASLELMSTCLNIQGGLRRGGLTPALAPRMPVMTGRVGKSTPSMLQYCKWVHKKIIVFCAKNTRFNEPASNLPSGTMMCKSIKKHVYTVDHKRSNAKSRLKRFE